MRADLATLKAHGRQLAAAGTTAALSTQTAGPSLVLSALGVTISNIEGGHGRGRRSVDEALDRCFNAADEDFQRSSVIQALMSDAAHFGHSSMNLGSLYKGLVKDTSKTFKHLRRTRHTHDPVDDARGNAEALLAMAGMGLKIEL